MSSNVLGKKVAKIALSYEGAKTGDKKHRKLVDTFNKVEPNGMVASYKDYWCAISWTAWQILAGMSHKDVPMGYNVPRLIEEAKARKIWVESDSYTPRAGDGIIYDWQDSGKGDNTGNGDHIGVVYKCTKDTIYVIEGNAGDKGVCKKRKVAINGRYIRGFITPKYNAIYIDHLARRYAWAKGTPKATYQKKPNKYFKRAWHKHFPKKKIGSGCHQFVMLVMRVAGYKVMPLAWDKIIKYLSKRCTRIAFKGVSSLKKGDIFVYRRVDKKGVKHHHIFIIVEIDGKLMIAEANQGKSYAHINTSLKKTVKTYANTWLFRPKEVR